MRKKIHISVITPSYNQGNYIERAIKSFIKQDYPYKEMRVIDGGSTDQTMDILKKYNKDISWISEKDKGYADAVNKGFAKSKGDVMIVQSSDDYFVPGALKTAVKYIKKYPDKSLWCGKRIYLDKNNKVVGSFSVPKAITLKGCLEGSSQPPQDSCFFKRSSIEKVRGFPVKFNEVADLLFYIKLLSLGEGCGFKDAISFYQYHEQQATFKKVNKYIKLYEKGLLDLSDKLSNDLLNDKVYIKSIIKLTQSFWLYRSGRFKEMGKFLNSSFNINKRIIVTKRFMFLYYKLIVYRFRAGFSFFSAIIDEIDDIISKIFAESSRAPKNYPSPDWFQS